MNKLCLLLTLLPLAACSGYNTVYQNCMSGQNSFRRVPVAGDPNFCLYAYGNNPQTINGQLNYPAPRGITPLEGNSVPFRGRVSSSRSETAQSAPARQDMQPVERIKAKPVLPAYSVQNMAKPDFPPAPNPYRK